MALSPPAAVLLAGNNATAAFAIASNSKGVLAARSLTVSMIEAVLAPSLVKAFSCAVTFSIELLSDNPSEANLTTPAPSAAMPPSASPPATRPKLPNVLPILPNTLLALSVASMISDNFSLIFCRSFV